MAGRFFSRVRIATIVGSLAVVVACSSTSSGTGTACTNDYSGTWRLSGCTSTTCTVTQNATCGLGVTCADGTQGSGSLNGKQASMSGVLGNGGGNGSCSMTFNDSRGMTMTCSGANSTQPCTGTGVCQSGTCGEPIAGSSTSTSGASGTTDDGGTSSTSGASGSSGDAGTSGASGSSGTTSGSSGGSCTTSYAGTWSQTGACLETSCVVSQTGCSVTVTCANGTSLSGAISGTKASLSGKSQGVNVSCTATFTSTTSYDLDCGICTGKGSKGGGDL